MFITRYSKRLDAPKIFIGLGSDRTFQQLLQELQEQGFPISASGGAESSDVFPLEVPVGKNSVVLDLATPAFLEAMNPNEIGFAVLDPLGYLRSAWGLAEKVKHFSKKKSVLETEIAGVMDRGAWGSHGALYLDGYRYFATSVVGSTASVFILVVNANDEQSIRIQASQAWRVANTLTRLGKALTMNQTTQHLCVATVHELASSLDLAAALLWVKEPDQTSLHLASSVGITRSGCAALGYLHPEGSASTLAELVAGTRQPVFIPNASRHMLSAEMEASVCYLKPGGIKILPLVISDHLLGVLELIGKEGDDVMEQSDELFETVGEHVALALNGAALFEQAERGAMVDPLTGIANHRAMQEFLSSRLTEAQRTRSELGVVMIDVDNFRCFNEEEGHDAGDLVLKMVAAALKSTVRPYDLAARYGGEEFTLVLPGAGRYGTLSLAERARQAVEGLSYITASGRQRKITISLGCAIFPNSAHDPQPLLKAADLALYQAKHAGKNRVVFCEGGVSFEEPNSFFDLDVIENRLRLEDRKSGREFLARQDPMVEKLSVELNLDRAQVQVLRGLLLVYPSYSAAIKRLDFNLIEAFEEADEFRVLLPHLRMIHTPFESGQLSLVTRILQVLIAVDMGEPRRSINKKGRFDPKVVSSVLPRKRAA